MRVCVGVGTLQKKEIVQIGRDSYPFFAFIFHPIDLFSSAMKALIKMKLNGERRFFILLIFSTRDLSAYNSQPAISPAIKPRDCSQ